MSVLTQNFDAQPETASAGGFFTRMIEWCMDHSGRGKAAKEASRLMQLSDEELKELRIPREQIVQRVFGAHGYL